MPGMTIVADSTTPADEPAPPTVAELLARISSDTRDLVRAEMELAKRELSASARSGGIAAVVFSASGVLLLLAVVLASVGGAVLIHGAGIALGWAFLIVAGGYLLLGGVFALVGRSAMKKVGPPRRTAVTVRDSVAALRGGKRGPGAAHG
jgi:hypothetical protein